MSNRGSTTEFGAQLKDFTEASGEISIATASSFDMSAPSAAAPGANAEVENGSHASHSSMSFGTQRNLKDKPTDVADWEWPGWGTAEIRSFVPQIGGEQRAINEDTPLLEAGQPHKAKEHKKLGQIAATSISGNDITSSCLYTAGICCYYSGKWAPISILIVCLALYLFRNIYSEVVSALPLNGGTYTNLLNTTTKGVASLAACLTLLSYIATAVVSASSAAAYAQGLYTPLDPMWLTTVILGLFAILSLIGIRESTPIAVGIFTIHLTTLSILIMDGFVVSFKDGFHLLAENWKRADTDVTLPTYGQPFASLIYFGYASALLGITGFETSANFVEEQKPGVFPKTLRNMWFIVAILNPLISFLSISVLPIDQAMGLPLVDGRPNNANLLQQMASTYWLQVLVSVNAALVLSGAVLTSYVGVIGLVRRMAYDRCLPGFLLAQNPLTHTNHFIIIGFFLVCSSLFYISGGNVLILGGVYAMAFLSVMSLFAMGNLFLKYNRGQIPRAVRASVPTVIIAFGLVFAGFIGNVVVNESILQYFLLYYGTIVVLVGIMFMRMTILKLLLRYLVPQKHNKIFGRWKPSKWFLHRVIEQARLIKGQKMVFFIKRDSLVTMNRAALYVMQNEQTFWLVFVHVFDTPENIPLHMQEHVHMLDEIYPKTRLDFLAVQGKFGPDVVDHLAKDLNIPKHLMFIGCPGDSFPHNIASLGGVRVIIT